MSNFYYTLLSFILAIISGLVIRVSLTFIKQKWASTMNNTLTFMLLPITTFVITKVISNNIALSLGMIGALSIVRFRNPVKSPLELSIYFVLITLGISYSVNLKYGILLTIFVSLVLLFSKYLRESPLLKKLNFFNSSFDEGEEKYSLEITSITEISLLKESNLLNSYYFNKEEGKYFYRLVSNDKRQINKTHEELNKEHVIETKINF